MTPDTLPQSPLADLHQASEPDGTEFIPYGQVQIVSTFGIPQAEYAAIHKAAGLLDLPQRGILEIAGKDRASFLNNFLTNLTWSKDTKTPMPPNTGVYAFLLNGKGRVTADMNVLETGQSIYLETDTRLLPLLRSSLEKYVFTEKVTFTSRTPDLSLLALHGPLALTVLQNAGAVLSELTSHLSSRQISLAGHPVLVFRDDPAGVPGYHLIIPRAAATQIWQLLTQPYESQTNKRTLRPVGWAMYNTCRIEAGRPLFGIDFTEESLPAETGRFEAEHAGAVSVTKGCYLGQEIVARMHARNQVAKKLVGLKISNDALPLAGTHLQDTAGNIVGTVTSSTLSPLLGNAAIALATLKKGSFDPGTTLSLPAEGSTRSATVTPLPFLPPPTNRVP